MKSESAKYIFDLGEKVLEIHVLTDEILRICCFPKGSEYGKDSDITVERIWDKVHCKILETDNETSIITSKVKVIITKKTGNITFFNAVTGGLILSEKPDGRIFTGAIVEDEKTYNVEQVFESSEDEVIYGLGQQQDGAINFKGRFVHLAQHNTIIAIPVLVSSRGYGILWNNCSLTEINRTKHPLNLESNLFSKMRCGTYTPSESGQYIFVARQTGKNVSRVHLKVDEVTIIDQQNMWLPNYFTGSTKLQAGKEYKISVESSVDVYIQSPSQSKYTSVWSEVGDSIDYYFLYGPEMDSIVSGYRELTGKVPMFGKWAYGFWQSKERYKNIEELKSIADEYRKRRYPLDNLVVDWCYWDGHGWNALKFDDRSYPDMEGNLKKLHDNNIHIMISVWPNFGDYDGSINRARIEFRDRNYLLEISPHNRHSIDERSFMEGFEYYDVFKEQARDFLWEKLKTEMFDKGMDAWWLDSCEPDMNCVQGSYHLYKTSKGSGARHLNSYSLLHTKGVYENQRKSTEGKRVFILARSAFAGQQRYAAAVWSGDINHHWIDFKRQIPAGINYCMSGLPYWTTDIGGFFGGESNKPYIRECYIRWFQYGTFCPIFRAHGTSTPREVWQYGKEAEDIMVSYLKLRYRLMPYIYSLAWMVTDKNYTMMRGLAMDFREDKKVLEIDDQFMFGPAFLVNPVTEEGATERKVYLPECEGWYDFWTGKYYDGGQSITAAAPIEKLPLFVKAGSIIPIGPEIQYACERTDKSIELRIFAGADGCFNFYEDENDNYNYEKGLYSIIPIEWRDKEREFAIRDRLGEFPGMQGKNKFRIIVIDEKNPAGIVRGEVSR